MNTIKACIVRPDGVMSYGDIEPTLEKFQEIVGGYIEGVRGQDFFAYCDEEGKLKGKPINPVATAVAGLTQDVLCGTVVFLGPEDNDGNETSVHPDVVVSVFKAGGK